MRLIPVLLLCSLLAGGIGPLPVAGAAPRATLVVTALNDAADTNPADCLCRTSDNLCTLRAALETANACSGPDVIHFAVAGIITPYGPLPPLSDTTGGTTIDGFSAPGAQANTAPITEPVNAHLVMALDGRNLPFNGLTINSDYNVLRGFAVYGFDDNAVAPFYGGILIAGGRFNVIAGNYIGLNAQASAGSAFQTTGVTVSALAKQNTIGGPAAGDRNVISGNRSAGVRLEGNLVLTNTVQGNSIGPAPPGNAALPASHQLYGVQVTDISYDNLVIDNLLSGNLVAGVVVSASGGGTRIERNTIGPAADANTVLQGADQVYGVWLYGGAAANILRDNLISANGVSGVRLDDAGTANNRLLANHIGPAGSAGTLAGSSQDHGVWIANGAGSTTIGEAADATAANVISYNLQDAVVVTGATSRNNRVQRNDLDANGPSTPASGLDLGGDGPTADDPGDADDGPNLLQNRPQLSNITPLVTELQLDVLVDTAPANAAYPLTIDIYRAGPAALAGQEAAGKIWLGSLTYSVSDAQMGVTRRFVPVVLPASGDLLVATATDANGNTGEFGVARAAGQAALVVNSLGDMPDANGNDCTCDTGNGACTLRAAIQTANSCPGTNAIGFGLAGTIMPVSPLPALSDPTGGLLVDAVSAPGARANTAPPEQPINALISVVLDGNGRPFDGLVLTGDDITLRGLAVRDFGGSGVLIAGGTNNRVVGSFLGTDAGGTVGSPAQQMGIQVRDGAHRNTIGGLFPADRNLISGNLQAGILLTGTGTLSNTIIGNFIGPDLSGAHVVSGTTQSYGLWLGQGAQYNLIGTPSDIPGQVPPAGSRNIISGNGGAGVLLSVGADHNLLVGNRIGPAAGGSLTIPGGVQNYGLRLQNAEGNRIGSLNAANQISGNYSAGLYLSGVQTTGNVVESNLIGPDVWGTGPLLGSFQITGVRLAAGAHANRIGGTPLTVTAAPGNLIRFNNGHAIAITGDTSTANQFAANSLTNATSPLIDLGDDGPTPNDPGDADEGPNRRQNAPVISGFESISGTPGETSYGARFVVDSAVMYATYPLTIEFFVSNSLYTPQTKTYIGYAIYPQTGAQTVVTAEMNSLAAVRFWDPVVATATDAAGNTSELSDAFCPAANPDVNRSGQVDVVDIQIIARYFGRTPVTYDANCDGVTDVTDLIQLAAAWQP